MEHSAFDKVGWKERTYSYWDLVAFWFGSTSLPAAWFYGALMAGWQGLMGAAFFIVVVNILSLIPWAYLGKISAETGASSIAIARPTFGIRGSIVPSIFYLILGAGWGVVNVFLGAIALSFIFKLWLGLPSYLDPNNAPYMVGYIILVCLIQGFFAITGSKGLKKIQWAATIGFVLLGIYQTYVVFSHWDVVTLIDWRPSEVLQTNIGPYTFPVTFALLVDLMIAYNWTWEFIGDFSRFAKTKKAGTWGPFTGAVAAQLLWFTVGAVAVVYLAVSTGEYSPLLADPSSTTVALGLGWLAAFIVLFATVTTNAGNIYATSLGVANIIAHKKHVSLNKLLFFVSLALIPLACTPLIATSFVGFYIFFLDFLGAIVVPLWTLILVDYFFIHKQKYTDDLFKLKGGIYWFKNGWNHSGVIALISGTVMYWICSYALPEVRHSVTATIPTMVFVTFLYLGLSKRNETK